MVTSTAPNWSSFFGDLELRAYSRRFFETRPILTVRGNHFIWKGVEIRRRDIRIDDAPCFAVSNVDVLQMFDSDRFFQACVVPYRTSDQGIEFCLITSKKSGKWSLAKGTIRSEETVSDTIARQAYKEAGVRGELIEKPIGTYSYHKWETILEVVVLLMAVDACADDWPDGEVRKRCWVGGDEAIRLLSKSDHKILIRKAIDRIT